MLTLNRATSTLLLIDFQTRLMPAIEGGAAMIANACRLQNAAELLDIRVIVTEQNAKGLGKTVPELMPGPDDDAVFHKTSFGACRMSGFLDRLPNRPDLVVAGCETHVCVLQTALGLIDAGRQVWLVRDAVGSRRGESKETAIGRLQRHGARIVTTEMVIFEWLETSDHPRFREALALVR
jgi:nicotinamidase-related amidase